MRKIKIKRSLLFILLTAVLSIVGCIKDTYNLTMLSKKAHLSPTLAISAVKGDISFADVVKQNDTVRFDQNQLVTLVFKQDSIIDMKPSDFSKGTVVKTAPIDPTIFDLNINDVLSRITGDFLIVSPTVKFSYTNSFTDSVKINLKAAGHRGGKKVDLSLKPFGLVKPNIPSQQTVTTSYSIDKTNSNLPQLVSLPPDTITFSGNVILTATFKGTDTENASVPAHVTGSLEIDIPLELRITNLQFSDTTDNFLKDNKSDNPGNPENFQYLKVIFSAKNGFPLGVAVKMALYDSASHSIKNTVNATGLLSPAPADSNGKSTGIAETSTTIEFNRDFFSSVNKADKIIFIFTMNTTGNGSQNVKIYSDYRINFTAAMVVKPDINLK
jgi:transcription antitermination factor NusG